MNTIDYSAKLTEEQLAALITTYANKTTDFRFSGNTLKFTLTQSLFSSFKIDSGSKLLLKALAKTIDLSSPIYFLDSGCGTGVIGLSIASKNRETKGILEDRDCLAVCFSKFNAAQNNISNITAKPSLLLEEQNSPFDLVVSNIPAKAGNPVITAFFRNVKNIVKPKGYVGIVIVSPLRELADSCIALHSYPVVYKEDTDDYSVRIFQPVQSGTEIADSELSQKAGIPAEYIRYTGGIDGAPLQEALDTVYGIPGFDSMDTGEALAFSLAPTPKADDILMVKDPGQGVLLKLLCKDASVCKQILLQSRDLLQLRISINNLNTENANRSCIINHPDDFGVSVQCTYALFPVIQEVSGDTAHISWKSFAENISSGGKLLLYGKSAYMARFLKKKQGFSQRAQKKSKGYKAVLLEKK